MNATENLLRGSFKVEEIESTSVLARFDLTTSFSGVLSIKAVLGDRATILISMPATKRSFELRHDQALQQIAGFEALWHLPESGPSHRLCLDGCTFKVMLRFQGGAWVASRHEGLQRGDRMTELVLALLSLAFEVTAEQDASLHARLKQWVAQHVECDNSLAIPKAGG